MTRCALYFRVSTGDQNTEMQRRELAEFCRRRGWEIVGEYEDVGVSGAADSRPALNRLMDDAAKRRFDVVCVWRFDRFARSVLHLLRALETFRAVGVEFVSYSENIDTSTPVGKMTFTVLGAVAELERSIIAERVKAGQQTAKAKGKHIGRPQAALDEHEMRDMLDAGHSMADVGAALGVSAATVCRRAQAMAWQVESVSCLSRVRLPW